MNRARLSLWGKAPLRISGAGIHPGPMTAGPIVAGLTVTGSTVAGLTVAGTLTLLLAACSPVGTAVGVAATTINLATQERGLVTGVDDNLIWVGINERLFRKDADLFQKVSLQVHEGRVLLSGFVQKPEHRVMATELAWQARGVREVDNQIRIGNSLTIDDYAEDTWLIARLRVKLMADSQVRANNYSIDCIRSTIYLIGVAQDETELQRVIDHARDIAYVDAVVTRVRKLDEPLPAIPETPPLIKDSPIANETLLVEAVPPARPAMAAHAAPDALPKSTPSGRAAGQAMAQPAGQAMAQPVPFQPHRAQAYNPQPYNPQPFATQPFRAQPFSPQPFSPQPFSPPLNANSVTSANAAQGDNLSSPLP